MKPRKEANKKKLKEIINCLSLVPRKESNNDGMELPPYDSQEMEVTRNINYFVIL